MRTGYSLPELLVVVIIIGILTAFGVPALVGIADAAAVRAEAGRVVAALDAARGFAVRLDVVTSLSMSDSAYEVTAIVGADTVTPWRKRGPAARGVTLVVPGRSVLFGPSGVGMGVSNRTIVLSRGRASRQVVVSRLGRITW